MFFKKKKKPHPDIEEAIAAGDTKIIELPLSESALRLLGFVMVAVAIIAGLRLWHLVYANGEFYQSRAAANANEVRIIEAKRGLFLDRFGNELVENTSWFNVRLRINRFIKASTEEQTELIRELEKNKIIDAISLKEIMEETDIEKNPEIIIARSASQDSLTALKRFSPSFLIISEDYLRNYKYGRALSSVLGYVGLVSREDIVKNPGFHINDLIGKNGLELQYDQSLRGKNGRFIIYRNALGEILGEQTVAEPQDGTVLELNIDAEFQEYFYQRFKRTLSTLGRFAGVGIAIDPRNGEILAFMSFPDYDANIFSHADSSEERKKILEDNRKPLFNRAVSGVYNPGSTIKPLVAIAALSEGIITPETKVFSAGFIEIPNPYFPDRPSIFRDWKPHGWVNLYSALARSSNVFFYAAGGGFSAQMWRELVSGGENIKGLGISKLKTWWEKFGFGRKTGIDLPGETEGLLPSAEYKETRTGEIWRVGDTYNVSIGQGDFLVTPIQLVNYISAIANGGIFYEPRLVNGEPEIIAYHDFGSALDEVRKGMEDAVKQSYGTAFLLSDLPFKVSAKTGTAQTNSGAKANALFVGYAPADNPQIALLIIVEDVPEDSFVSVPLAREVLRWYYEHRIKNET